MSSDTRGGTTGSAPPDDDRRDRDPDAVADSRLTDNCERDLLVRRYLLGYLSEDEAEAFEERFIHDQSLLDELDEAERFIEGVRGLASDGRLERLEAPRRRAVEGIARGGARAWGLPAVCAGLAVIAAIFAVYSYGELRGARRELAALYAPQVNTQIVDLEVMRGAPAAGEPARPVRLPAEPGWIVLAMDTGSTSTVERQARLLDSTERIVAESAGLHADGLGVVYWTIHSSMLREGDYVAQVGAAGGSSAPEIRYPLRVMGRG
jgi:hypothetical protein